MKIIDLLNKIANGEEVPKEFKFKDYKYYWDSGFNNYYNKMTGNSFSYMAQIKNLNEKIELIEEQQDIDIQRNRRTR